LIGPTPLGRGYDARAFTQNDRTRRLRTMIAAIPPDATISASRNLLSWFSEREGVHRFPEVGDARYVLLDYRDLRFPAVYSQDDNALGQLLTSPSYRLAATMGATMLFARGDPTAWPPNDVAPTQFGNQIELLDAHLQVQPSARVVVVFLTWRAVARPSKQYTVFVHVLGGDDRLLGQADSWPLDNLYPTDLWVPGRVVPDTHTAPLAGELPAGPIHAEVGLYD